LQGKLDHISQDDRGLIELVLLKYAHVFHDEDTCDFKCTVVMEHQIFVGDTPPIRQPQYRTPYAQRQRNQGPNREYAEKGNQQGK